MILLVAGSTRSSAQVVGTTTITTPKTNDNCSVQGFDYDITYDWSNGAPAGTTFDLQVLVNGINRAGTNSATQSFPTKTSIRWVGTMTVNTQNVNSKATFQVAPGGASQLYTKARQSVQIQLTP